jgi:hypothetical protein
MFDVKTKTTFERASYTTERGVTVALVPTYGSVFNLSAAGADTLTLNDLRHIRDMLSEVIKLHEPQPKAFTVDQGSTALVYAKSVHAVNDGQFVSIRIEYANDQMTPFGCCFTHGTARELGEKLLEVAG